MTEQRVGVALLFEQTARLLYENKTPGDLHAVQWAALRYFARANKSARTVAGLARFLGVTDGPASRTAASLGRRGLLSSAKNPDDGRSTIFSVTSEGRTELSEDPIQRAAIAIEDLSVSDRKTLIRVLNRLYQALSAADEFSASSL